MPFAWCHYVVAYFVMVINLHCEKTSFRRFEASQPQINCPIIGGTVGPCRSYENLDKKVKDCTFYLLKQSMGTPHFTCLLACMQNATFLKTSASN